MRRRLLYTWGPAAMIPVVSKVLEGSKERLLAELKTCSITRNLERGKIIHADAMDNGNGSCIYVATALVHMYAKCGSMVDARRLFDGIKQPDVVLWNALMLGYADNGEGVTTLDLFARMISKGCTPDSRTFVAALKACTVVALQQDGSKREECKQWGKHIHSNVGSHLDIYVQSSLIDMYAKCGSMIEAREVFDSIKHPNVVSWNALILGYAETREGVTALEMFARMRYEGCAPNSITFIAALKACTSLAVEHGPKGRAECRELGKKIHLSIDCHITAYIESILIEMYAKCGSMVEARHVFDSIKHPDVVSWNILILGYVENGEGIIALDLFDRMRCQSFAPNCITFIAALKACGLVGALDFGSHIHAKIHGIIDMGMEGNATILVNCLVDFYSKCGSMVKAQQVFDSHRMTRNLVTWNALLAGYSRVGNNEAVFGLFEGMQDAGFQPDGVTFLCILTCCSHAGLLEKAKEFFEAMSTNYGISPSIEHYNCMVDILGRSNKLDDAMALLRGMPCKPNAVTWMTILGACCKWKNVEIGSLAFKILVSLDGMNAAAYANGSKIIFA